MIEIPVFILSLLLLLGAGLGYFVGTNSMRLPNEATSDDVIEAGGRIESRLDLIEDMLHQHAMPYREEVKSSHGDPLGQMSTVQHLKAIHGQYRDLVSDRRRRA